MSVLSPVDTASEALDAGIRKSALSRSPGLRLGALSVIAGAYIALGGALSVLIGFGFPGITSSNPGLQRLLSGLAFPIGLTLIVILGGELFTGNNALLIPGVIKRKITLVETIKNWTLVWIGNFIGALIFVLALVWSVGLFDANPWHDATVAIATAKVQMAWHVVFLKGIGANWCVCLAVWMSLSTRQFAGKVLACWIPVAAFVALGFEHCIANMFFIPCGMLYGADVSVAQMFTANLIPATLGNVIGGALPVGALHTWLHLKR